MNAATLGLFLTSLSGAVNAQQTTPRTRSQVRVATKTVPGLHIVTFKTPQGQIHITLPADMRPGDALLATTRLEPKGKQATDQDSNLTQLSAYTLSLTGQSHPSQEPVLHWNLPADLKGEDFFLILTDPSAQEAARTPLPLSVLSGKEEGGPDTNAGLAPQRASLPTKGQAGRPLVFAPSFPGGTEDLHILVGEKEARLLAASPRSYVVESPREVLGKTKLQVRRGSELVAEGDYRNNRVGSSSNPWGYILGAAVIIGVVSAFLTAKAANDVQNGFGSLHF